MTRPSDTLHIIIEYHDGQDEGDDGHPYYVASNDEIGLVTDGRTWYELMQNLKEAMDAALIGEDTVAAYNLVPNPRLVITMELPENYAEIVWTD